MAKEKESLQKLYVEQLRDLYSAESQMLEALSTTIQKTTHAELKSDPRTTRHRMRRDMSTTRLTSACPGCATTQW